MSGEATNKSRQAFYGGECGGDVSGIKPEETTIPVFYRNAVTCNRAFLCCAVVVLNKRVEYGRIRGGFGGAAVVGMGVEVWVWVGDGVVWGTKAKKKTKLRVSRGGIHRALYPRVN